VRAGIPFLLAQALFLGVFVFRAARRRREAATSASRAQAPRAAPGARALLAFHCFGVVLVLLGMFQIVAGWRARVPLTLRYGLAIALVLAASALAMWALRVFTSWRLLAHVDAGHALCTSGPYRFVRHPIYAAMDLWALGSAIACPALAAVVGLVVIVVGSDLRCRAEETLLTDVFGDEYRDYMGRVRRLLPGMY
jgi:protein-S-isoprenylcysteine O-methyltransferase Ste14